MRLPILHARLASDIPAADRPRFEVLRTNSTSYRTWRQFKANRQDTFFLRPVGALDVCNALPPVRAAP